MKVAMVTCVNTQSRVGFLPLSSGECASCLYCFLPMLDSGNRKMTGNERNRIIAFHGQHHNP